MVALIYILVDIAVAFRCRLGQSIHGALYCIFVRKLPYGYLGNPSLSAQSIHAVHAPPKKNSAHHGGI